MKKLIGSVALLFLFALPGFSQEHYTEGPVWRVQLIRVKPAHMDHYLTSLRKSTKPLLDEEKRAGDILDYKVFLKETKSSPDDWDIAIAVLFKNHAAMDGAAAKGEAARDKLLGKQAAQDLADKRAEYREVISSSLMQEITLK